MSENPPPSRWPKSRLARAAVVVAGIVFGQIVLYGPSLAGRTVLLPVDLLAQPRWYLPQTPETAAVVPHNVVLSDPVLQYEVWRRFAAQEMRAGRLPLWNPYNYGGSPFVLSPSPDNVVYWAISWLVSAPLSLAWVQLLKSLLAGIGVFLFFRRGLGVGFAPAAIGGICYPVSGFLVLWQAYPLSSAAAFLPWILLATDRAIRRPGGWGGVGLALFTCLALVTSVDIAGQALLAAALYAVWCWIDAYGWPPSWRITRRALAAVTGAWVLGILLATPVVLPLAEYIGEGARISARARGVEERPPVGLAALPQVVLPDLDGSWQRDSYRLGGGNRLESPAAAYTGFVATLLVAPLAFRSRRHRSRNLLWLILAVLGLGWSLGLPGLVHLLRLPGLNLLSYNRAVFVSSFAILSLAVTGLSWLGRGGRVGRREAWVFGILLTLLAGWIAYRSAWLPDLVAAGLAQGLEGGAAAGVADAAAVERVRQGFVDAHRQGVAWCALALLGWLALRVVPRRRPWVVPLVGALLLGELLLFARGLSPQLDPELYYPPIEVLEELAKAPPGRVLGVDCLPPGLNMRFGLRDVRGYDAVDPARMLELLDTAADPASVGGVTARTLWLRPRTVELGDGGVRVPPVLDMLGVRYLVFRGAPPEGFEPLLLGEDHWVAENPAALPRAFVPRRVRRVADRKHRLRLLEAVDFDPREVAYVEAPGENGAEAPVGVSAEPAADLAAGPAAAVHGSAEIVAETPTRVTVALDMGAPGLVVLSDRWHTGWKARVDGEPTVVLRTNHAVRGVRAPAGRSTLVFSYEPASFALGTRLAAAALAGLLVWVFLVARRRRAERMTPAVAAAGPGRPMARGDA